MLAPPVRNLVITAREGEDLSASKSTKTLLKCTVTHGIIFALFFFPLQAAIAAVHAEAASLEETDWAQIVGLYDELLRLNPSPVVALNRAVALAMHEGEEVGLMEVERLLASGELDGYHLLHAARADLLRRLGRTDQAIAAYRQALALAQQGADRQFLQKRLEELGSL